MILSELIWFNSNIKVDSKPVHFHFSIGQLFNDNGNINPLKDLKVQFNFKDTHKIYWLQIINVLPRTWKDII